MKFLLVATSAAIVSAQTETSPCAGDLVKSIQMATCLATGINPTADTCTSTQAQITCIEGLGCMSDQMCTSYKAVCADVKCTASTCFPATATVELANGKTKSMDQVVVGDNVRVGPKEFSEVYFFSTEMAETTSKFTKIMADGVELMLSAGHYLYVNGELATAGSVKGGDVIVLANGSKASVSEVSEAWGPGLYNPHTLNGDIIVNGVKTSTYTEAVHPRLAHALLSPLRTMYSAGVTFGKHFSGATKGLPSWMLKAIGA